MYQTVTNLLHPVCAHGTNSTTASSTMGMQSFGFLSFYSRERKKKGVSNRWCSSTAVVQVAEITLLLIKKYVCRTYSWVLEGMQPFGEGLVLTRSVSPAISIFLSRGENGWEWQSVGERGRDSGRVLEREREREKGISDS